VWRAELSGQPVVVKQLVPAGPEAAGRYAREVGALRLAGAARPPVAPRLLGSDPGERVLVLEYLKEDRPPGADAMTGWAEALARLHAAGVPGADDGLPRWPGPSAGDVEAFLTLARALGVPAAAPAELAGVVSRLAELPAQALLHGDPCPDNALHTADGVRFIDFEQAARGNGLVELAYLRIGFPTCWCATSPDPGQLDAAETAYRSAWRTATGGDVEGDLTDACVGWLLRGDGLVERAERTGVDHWGRLLDQDWTWGTATARQRLLHRLLVVGQLAADGGRAGRLADTGRLAGEMAGAVLDRWPGLRPLPSRWRWWDGLGGG
jgi:Phosphotransferase enzyme family